MKAQQTLFLLSLLSMGAFGCAVYEPESMCKPACEEGFICIKDQCVQQSPFLPCKTSDDCYNGTQCIQNLCVCLPETQAIQYCSSTQVCCAKTGCSDLLHDNANCGVCGYACPEGLSCTNKTCRSDTVCTNGVKKCNETQDGIDICLNGRWVKTDQDCLDNQVCINSACVVETCTPPAMRCKNGNVEYCLNNAYSIYDECTPPDRCDDETFSCETPPECENDDMGCTDDGNVQQCIDEQWVQIQECPENKHCNKTTFTCVGAAACLADEKTCDGTSVKSCLNGQWTTAECPTGTICDKGTCVKRACDKGEVRCATNAYTHQSEIHVCKDNAFVLKEACMSGENCTYDDHTNTASCEKETCTWTYQCQGQTLYKCAQGTESVVKQCTETETCDSSLPDCVSNCGNGILESNEECDSDTRVSPNHTCAAIFGSHYSGTVTCTSLCTVNTTGCSETSITPPDITKWDFEQDFNAFPKNTTYSSERSSNDKGISWTINGAIKDDADYTLNGTRYAVFTSRNDSKNQIEATGITKGIGTFYFDYRGWNTDTGSFKVILTKNGTQSEDIVEFDGSQLAYQKTYDDKTITAITIAIIPNQKTSHNGRLCLDNVRWTNPK